MGTFSYTRSIVVVLAAMLLLGFIDQTLEQTLVMSLANAPVKDEASRRTENDRLGRRLFPHCEIPDQHPRAFCMESV